jgi:hypothetical protein
MDRDSTRVYLLITGVIFGFVAVMHLLRVLNGWSFEIGPILLPIWMSWGGFIAAAALSAWAMYLARTRTA